MAAILALLPAIFQLIPLIETGVSSIVRLIGSIRTAATQANEWTPELEAQFIAMLLALATRPEQQPDPTS